MVRAGTYTITVNFSATGTVLAVNPPTFTQDNVLVDIYYLSGFRSPFTFSATKQFQGTTNPGFITYDLQFSQSLNSKYLGRNAIVYLFASFGSSLDDIVKATSAGVLTLTNVLTKYTIPLYVQADPVVGVLLSSVSTLSINPSFPLTRLELEFEALFAQCKSAGQVGVISTFTIVVSIS